MASGRKILSRFLFCAVIAMSLLASSSIAYARQTDVHGDDEKMLRAQADDYVKAFASGNASAIANMWTVDGNYIDADGRDVHGRDNIEKLFQSYFKDYGTQPIKISIDSFKFPASNVAIEEGTSALLQNSEPSSMSRYTVVHVKENGKWLMSTVSETNCQQTNSNSLNDLAWLAGKWQAHGQSMNVPLRAQCGPNHHFIFIGPETPDGAPFVTHVIGWNPLSKQVFSWHFDPSGGFGTGTWSRAGDTWTENALGVQSDGSTSRAQYVLHKMTNDKFTWQSINRTVAGLPLPDTQEIIVIRDQASK